MAVLLTASLAVNAMLLASLAIILVMDNHDYQALNKSWYKKGQAINKYWADKYGALIDEYEAALKEIERLEEQNK